MFSQEARRLPSRQIDLSIFFSPVFASSQIAFCFAALLPADDQTVFGPAWVYCRTVREGIVKTLLDILVNVN